MDDMRLLDKAAWYAVLVVELGLLWTSPVSDAVCRITGHDPLEIGLAGWERFVRSLPQRRQG